MTANKIFHNTSFFSDKIISTISTIAPLNWKQAAALESSGTTAEILFLAKKQKYYNPSLFLNNNEWPPLNKLWEIVGNCILETYLKSQSTLEEFLLAARIFFGCLCLIVCSLHLD